MNYYEEIHNLKTAKDFIRVVEKWEKLSANLNETDGVDMVLPDLLWVSKSGVGKTHLLRLLGEYLFSKKNLMEFYGNVKYFEFMLDYCPPEKSFTEIERMINEVSISAGFRNLYKGIISIDIDEWVGHCEEKHFISFLEYLSSNSNDWLIIFNVSSEDNQYMKQLESILAMYFRIEKSILQLPENDDFLEFITLKLHKYNLTLDNSAKKLLLKTIEKLRENKYFDGYKTLAMLCQDIVYEFFSSDNAISHNITEKDLIEFAPESDYIARATWKAENKLKIGLLK